MEIIKIISEWNKPVSRFVKRDGEFIKEKVRTDTNEKTVMALVKVGKNIVTRHITVPR